MTLRLTGKEPRIRVRTEAISAREPARGEKARPLAVVPKETWQAQGAASRRFERAATSAAALRRIGISNADLKWLATQTPRRLADLGQVPDTSQLGQAKWLVASAGNHSLFNALFGRDSLRMAMDVTQHHPEVAQSTLEQLFMRQGRQTDARSEEELGRIPHEVRPPGDRIGIELAKNWGKRPGISGVTEEMVYYGTNEATPLSVVTANALRERMGDAWFGEWLQKPIRRPDGTVTTPKEALLLATAWTLRRMNAPDGGGFLWNHTLNPAHGIRAQGWMDSIDGVAPLDNKPLPADQQTVLVESQGHAYDALLATASLLERFPMPSRELSAMAKRAGLGAEELTAPPLRGRARDLERRVVRDFWLKDERTFGKFLRLSASGKWVVEPIVSSNGGQLLSSHLLDGAKMAPYARGVASRMMQDDMLSPAGVKTLSSSRKHAKLFNPRSYQLGSSWPFNSLDIARGMRRHAALLQARGDSTGARDMDYGATDLENRALRAVTTTRTFAEYFVGSGPDQKPEISAEKHRLEISDAWSANHMVQQPPQETQGWTVTGIYRVLRDRGLLGAP